MKKILEEINMSNRLTIWGRWCLPSFNKHCNQLLKGALADMDNHMCDRKPLKKKVEKKDIVPWENPSLMVMINSYGF